MSILAFFSYKKRDISSGVYICKSIVNHVRHGNYICKSEGIYLLVQEASHFLVSLLAGFDEGRIAVQTPNVDVCPRTDQNLHDVQVAVVGGPDEIPVEFTYVNQ
jgi:hypothetical protein